MLDAKLNAHLDKLENIEGDMEVAIDRLINSINIDAIMDNAEEAMTGYAQEVKVIMLGGHSQTAIESGVELAKTVERKDVTVQVTNDPKLNEGELQ